MRFEFEAHKTGLYFPVVSEKTIQKASEKELKNERFNNNWSILEQQNQPLSLFIEAYAYQKCEKTLTNDDAGVHEDEAEIREDVVKEEEFWRELVDDQDDDDLDVDLLYRVRLFKTGAMNAFFILAKVEKDEGLSVPTIDYETIKSYSGSYLVNSSSKNRDELEHEELILDKPEEYAEENPHFINWVKSLGKIEQEGAMVTYILTRKQFYEDQIKGLLQ